MLRGARKYCSSTNLNMALARRLRFIDIGVNLTDPVFRGKYHGTVKHEDDFNLMLERSRAAGVKNIIITGGSFCESQQALELAKANDLYATVGCHPTRSAEFDEHKGGPEAYLNELDNLLENNIKVGKGRVVAVGECGLDYDRTHFAPPEVQMKHFRSQLSLAKKYHLPLFLHLRAAHKDFVNILREEGFGIDGGMAVGGKGGVVHSFTGTSQELAELMSMGFHIGVNGCSLKTADNLAVVQAINLDLLMLETDAPWCSMTGAHASKPHLDTLPKDLKDLYHPPSVRPERFVSGKAVKGRNEPCTIGGVAWVVSQLHPEVTLEELVEKAWKNTVKVFGLESLDESLAP
ncbi:Mg-dependent DNase [Rhodocollybia butyracea]|uniref:Mg-dependent DNase n=1 Tax=Rhodocollybia butyracea TaxID=206335 RepID=A0A9P5UF95_9AGAR|nr:Mg-dependent DNase [Rhodocollybia butyracea]